MLSLAVPAVRRTRLRLALVVLACALAAVMLPGNASAMPADTLVTNGDFSQPSLVGGYGIFGGSIPGWSDSTGCGIEVWSSGFIVPPSPAGGQVLELDSNCPSQISQSLATEPGQIYLVTYYFGARPHVSDPATNKIEASWDGAVKQTWSTGDPTLRRYRYFARARGTSTTLTFADRGLNDSVGTLLSGVSVVPSDGGPVVLDKAGDIAQGPTNPTPQSAGSFAATSAITISADHPELGQLSDHGDGTWTWTWNHAPSDELRPTSITVTATDAGGHTGTDSFTATPQSSFVVAAKAHDAVDLTGYPLITSGRFADADGDRLTLSADNTEGTFVDHGDGSWTWALRPSADTAATAVHVTADDGDGHTVNDSFLYGTTNRGVSVPLSCLDPTQSQSLTVSASGMDPGQFYTTLLEPYSGNDYYGEYAQPVGFRAKPSGAGVRVVHYDPVIATEVLAFPSGPAVYLKLHRGAGHAGSVDAERALPLCNSPEWNASPPTVVVPNDMTVAATGPDGATVSYGAVTAIDNYDGPVPASCSTPSGDRFPLGSTTVTCSATDRVGTTGTASFVVTVADENPPTLSETTDVTAEATGPDGAKVTYTAPTASDDVDDAVATTCSPDSGSTFAVGTTKVTCSATDHAGNKGTASFDVKVVDTTPPAVDLRDHVKAEATGPDGATVDLGATAKDLVDGTVDVSCTPASGTRFALGDTPVSCSATDHAGNEATATTTVTVADTTAPALSLPKDRTVEATGPDGATASYSASATDLVDGDRPVSCTPASGATFALGATPVDCSSSDQAGNRATGAFTVTVVDTTAPEVTVPADIAVDASAPAGAPVTFTTSAADTVSGVRPVSCSRPDGSAVASGDVLPIGTMTVTCSAKDAAGNAGSASFTVLVRSPAQAAANLQKVLTSFSLTGGSATAIGGKIDSLIAALPATGTQGAASACRAITPLNNQVRAQTGTEPGKQLTQAQGDQLLAITKSISGALGC